MSNIAKRVDELIRETVTGMGYDLFDVKYHKEADGMNLDITIDKEGGIAIEDCETVSTAVDPIIEEANVIRDEYNLNVMSVSLDRPIKDERDFIRNRGKLVEISLFAKQNGRKDFTGALTAWDTETVTITEGETTLQFERKRIAHIAPHIKF